MFRNSVIIMVILFLFFDIVFVSKDVLKDVLDLIIVNSDLFIVIFSLDKIVLIFFITINYLKMSSKKDKLSDVEVIPSYQKCAEIV